MPLPVRWPVGTPVWTTPPDPAPALGCLAVLVAALVGASSLSATPGLGWLLTTVAVAGAALVTGLAAGRTGRQRHGLVAGVVALPVLMAPTLFRSATWLDWMCVVSALLTASLALSGGRTWRAVFPGGLAVFAAAPMALVWFGRGIRSTGGRRALPSPRTLLAALVGVVLLVVFGALFASADPTFGDLIVRALRPLLSPDVPRLLVALLFTAVLAGGIALLPAHPPRLARLRLRRHGWLRRIEWALPLALLDLMFLAFVLVQIGELFGGRSRVLGPAGPTYASYARQGFAQLVVVTVLTLLVVALVLRKARRRAVADRRLLRVLLGALCLLALVVVASAVRRLALYEQVYGYTRLRLVVHAGELWLGVVLVLVLLAGIRLRGRWLPWATVLAGAVTVLVLAWLNPDATIAEHNIARYQRTGRLDTAYLAGLSPDAAPALEKLPPRLRACARPTPVGRASDWYRWNAATAHARTLHRAAAPLPPCEHP